MNWPLCYIYSDDLKSAIKTYNSLEDLKGINYYTSTQKYKIYLELEDLKNAARELELFLEDNPHDIQVYEMLSDCYILDNNFEKAFQVLKKLSELNPASARRYVFNPVGFLFTKWKYRGLPKRTKTRFLFLKS